MTIVLAGYMLVKMVVTMAAPPHPDEAIKAFPAVDTHPLDTTLTDSVSLPDPTPELKTYCTPNHIAKESWLEMRWYRTSDGLRARWVIVSPDMTSSEDFIPDDPPAMATTEGSIWGYLGHTSQLVEHLLRER